MADLKRHQEFDIVGESPQGQPDAGAFWPEFVSAEVLPSLMRSYGLDRSWLIRQTPTITQTDINLFCELVHSGDDQLMTGAIAALRSQGLSSQQLLLDLLTHVAQELGRRWTSDETDFSSVTIALGHLQQLRRTIAQMDPPGLIPSGPPYSALLAPTPGEQHNFGMMIVDHFLHIAGWDVVTRPTGHAEEIVNLVSDKSFEIAGLSISGESYLMSLERLIATIRRVSKNPNIGIMVGGPLLIERPELALLIGADATARDGQDAARQAERLVIHKASSSEQLME